MFYIVLSLRLSVCPSRLRYFVVCFFSHLYVSDGSGYDSPEPFLTDGGPSSRAGCVTLLAAMTPLFLGLFFWLWPIPPSSWSSHPGIMGWTGCPSKSTTPQGSPLTPPHSPSHLHLNMTTNHPHCQLFHGPATDTNPWHGCEGWVLNCLGSCPSSPIPEFWVEQSISEGKHKRDVSALISGGPFDLTIDSWPLMG